MKYFLFVTALLFACSAQSQITLQHLGKVYVFRSNSKIESITEKYSGSDKSEKWLYSFNSEQQLIAKKTENQGTENSFTITWEYKPKDSVPFQETERILKNQNELLTKSLYNYDDSGNLIRIYGYERSVFTELTTIEYKIKGFPSFLKTEDAEGRLTGYEQPEYDFDANLVTIYSYNKYSMLTGITISPIDSQGTTMSLNDFLVINSFKEYTDRAIKPKELTVTYNFAKYTYNKEGLWTKKKIGHISYNPYYKKQSKEVTDSTTKRQYQFLEK